MPTETDDAELLLAVARRYYEDNATQMEIAHEIGVSRPTVSRMLSEARRRGIVRISVCGTSPQIHDLARKLDRTFNLMDSAVVATPSTSVDGLAALGKVAAGCLDHLVADGSVIGVSNGRSIAQTVACLTPARARDVTVVQLIGSVGRENPMVDGPDITRLLADRYAARYRALYAPLVVEDVGTRLALERYPGVAETLALGRRADIALVGIGVAAAAGPSHIFDGYVSRSDLVEIHAHGGVGHLCGQFFDANGHPVPVTINDRIVGIGLASLRRVPRVVAVAGGAEKAVAILGALRGGLVDTLVTDHAAAVRLCELHHADSAE